MAQSSTIPSLAPQVQTFVSTPRRMLIDGAWVEAASGKTFRIYDPATEEIIAHVAEGEAEDIDRAVRAARLAFDGGIIVDREGIAQPCPRAYCPMQMMPSERTSCLTTLATGTSVSAS